MTYKEVDLKFGSWEKIKKKWRKIEPGVYVLNTSQRLKNNQLEMMKNLKNFPTFLRNQTIVPVSRSPKNLK